MGTIGSGSGAGVKITIFDWEYHLELGRHDTQDWGLGGDHGQGQYCALLFWFHSADNWADNV